MRFGLWFAVCLAAAAQERSFHFAGLIVPLEKWHNHVSSIVGLPDEDLLTVWCHGSGERKADDVIVEAARLPALMNYKISSDYLKAGVPKWEREDNLLSIRRNFAWMTRAHPLAVPLPENERRSSKRTRHLEKQPGSFHYPSIEQAAGGSLHASYTHFVSSWKAIRHARFKTAWMKQGDPQ
jgi:hypothetical protein